jgi:hypothetical protein
MKQRYESHVNRSSAAGEHESALAASISVGIAWSRISRKNSSLRTISFCNSPGEGILSGIP